MSSDPPGGPLDRLRVDNVGSLLRPPALGEAFARWRRGEIPTGTLHEAQDEAVREVVRAQEAWARRAFPKLTYFNEVDRGGHFAMWEYPELFAAELRAAFRSLR